MSAFNDQMVDILDRYIEEVNSEPTSLDDVVDWAISQRLYSPSPRDVRKIFRQELAESIRKQKRFDGTRWYRAKHPVRSNLGGVQLSLWADIDRNASLGFIEKSVSQQRRSMVGTAFQLKMVVDHYNEAHPEQRQIPLVLDLTEDVAELEASQQDDDSDDEAA
jgi:hypothetical protein